MFVTQLSVFVENKFGGLSEALDVLAENKINIRALSLAETAEYGILRMIVDDVKKAQDKLAESGFAVKSREVIELTLEDTPGGLSSIVNLFKDNGISIEYLYAFFNRDSGHPQMVCRVDDVQKAEKLLSGNKKY